MVYSHFKSSSKYRIAPFADFPVFVFRLTPEHVFAEAQKMEKDCCKDKQMSFKLKADQQKYSPVAFDLFHCVDAASETKIPEYSSDDSDMRVGFGLSLNY